MLYGEFFVVDRYSKDKNIFIKEGRRSGKPLQRKKFDFMYKIFFH